MIRAILQRLETSDEGTFGKIEFGGHAWHTGELPWRDNKPLISCIPAGTYLVEMDPSPRFGRDLYELRKVPGRTVILIHPANFCGDRACGLESELNGCIALGLSVGSLRGQKAVLASGRAVAQFQAALNREPFMLEVRDIPGIEWRVAA